MGLGIRSDALTYTSNQNALLNSTLVNNSLSAVFEGGELVTEVVSSAGAVVFRDVKVVGSLISADRLTHLATWNVGGNQTGEYVVNAELYLDSQLITQASTRVEIVSTATISLSGRFELLETRLVKPATIFVEHELLNTGDADIGQAVIELQLLDNADTVLKRVEQQVVDLSVGLTAQFSSSFASDDLATGDYQVRICLLYTSPSPRDS